jgi:amino acid permease
MSAGGFNSSLLTLSCSMIGIGFLTLPEMGKTNGLIPMVILILLSAFVSAFANVQLGNAFRAIKSPSLLKMIAMVNGRPSALFCIIVLIIDIWVAVGAMYIFGTLS